MQRDAEFTDDPHGLQDGGSPSHIRFHIFQVFGWLDADTAAVECDPFANQDHRIQVCPTGIVLQDDEARRFGGCFGDCQESTHLALGSPFAISDGQFHPIFSSDFFCHPSQIRGGDFVWSP